jgi:guanylate kinase
MSNKAPKAFRVWIVSGPSGSGKTTLCEALLKDVFWKKRLTKSVSVTTRPRRAGEVNGEDYCFITPQAFVAGLKGRGFLEYERIYGFYYGTPKKAVRDAQRAGKDLLLCIDVKGAQTLRRVFKKQAVSVFILPPHIKTLSERLKKRSTEGKKDIEKRLKRVKIELSLASQYDYCIVNDDFQDALKKIKAVFLAQTIVAQKEQVLGNIAYK